MKKLNKILQSKLLLWGMMIAGIAPLIIIAIYNRQSADDYGYARFTHQAVVEGKSVLRAAFQTMIYYMNNWNGLYFSSFMQSLSFGIYGEQFCFMNTVVIVASLTIGLSLLSWVCVRKVAREQTSNWKLAAGIAIVYLLQTLVCPVQGLYWYNGAANYMFMMGIFFSMLAVIIWYVAEPNSKHKKFIFVAGIILSTLTAGGHTIVQCLGIGFSFLLSIYCLRKKTNREAVVFCVCQMIGFFVNLFSPGSIARFWDFEVDLSFVVILKRTFAPTIQNGIQWSTVSMLLFMVAEVIVLRRVIMKLINQYEIQWKHVVFAFLFHFLVVFCINFIAVFVNNNVGLGRIDNLQYTMFVMGALIDAIVGAGYILCHTNLASIVIDSTEEQKEWYRMLANIMVAGAIFYISVFGMGTCIRIPYGSNAVNAMKDLMSGEAKVYAQEMDERIEILEESAGKNVTVEPLTCYPYLLYFVDIETDKTDWKNITCAEYYHLNSITRLPKADGE